MRLSRRTSIREVKVTIDELPWVPEDLAINLSRVTSFLRQAFSLEVLRIGLYGSWQRGDVRHTSDVDLVVFLNHEVPWFDATNGILNRSDARGDRVRWHAIAKEANTLCADSRAYSIVVVTQGMLDYYASRGPIHLQNWVHAVQNCHLLWETGT